MQLRFLPNLRSMTIDPGFREHVRSGGYLVPPQKATTALAQRAARIRRVGRLMVDNGNFERIAKVAARFAPRAAKLFSKIQRREKRLGRCVEASDLSRAQQKAYRDLADDIARAVRSSDATAENVRRQLALSPSHLVGNEDITLAVWLSLNIEEEYLGYPPRYYGSLNRSVALAAPAVGKALERGLRSRFYPVASALSYDTAYEAGRAFASAGVRRVSMGFGAYMADDHYRDHLFVGRRRIDLKGRMPNRYVRTAAAALGFWDGYRAAARRAPRAFHFLGLGAPIMLPIVALCAWGTPDVTFDATSPIRDAAEGFLYVSVPAYLKLRTRKVALAIAAGRRTWDCPCGFCRDFQRRHPFDYEAAKTWYARRTRTDVKPTELRPRGALYAALPLLSEPKTGTLRKEIDFARMGHNHWVLDEIVRDMRRSAGSQAKLRAHAHKVVADYAKSTDSEQFARAMTWVVNFVSARRAV
jgi:hypothetical protein